MSLNIYLSCIGMAFIFCFVTATFVIHPILKKDYAGKVRPDIDLAEMQELERNLALFLSENKLKPGASVWKIARALKVIDVGSVDDISSRARIYEPGANGNHTVVHSRGVPDN